MALQNWILVCPVLPVTNLATNDTSYQLTSTRTRIASVFRIPRTGNITHIKFRVGQLTTAQPLRVTLQTVDSNGNPSGTNYGGSGVGMVSAPAADTVYEVELLSGGNSAPASATAGDIAAVVIEWDGTAGSLFLSRANGGTMAAGGFPYDTSFSSSAWLAVNTRLTQLLMIGLRYGNDGYVPSTLRPVLTTASSYTYNSSSSPNEYGNRFTLPYPARVWGAMFKHIDSSALGPCDLRLYDNNGNHLTSGEPTPMLTGGLRRDVANAWVWVQYTSPIDLAAGTYIISLRPTTTTNVKTIACIFSSQQDRLDTTFGFDLRQVSRTGAGSWTENNLRYVPIIPIFSAFDDATGSGSAGGFPFPPHIIVT